MSWRLAEYLNHGLFVLSFPFKVELPRDFEQGENISFIASTQEYKDVLDRVLSDSLYHEKISLNGKNYFNQYCTPVAQAKYIIELIIKNI